MKFLFSNLSSNILNYFWDISKNVILSIYFLLEIVFFFSTIFLTFLENLTLSLFYKTNFQPAGFVIFFLNNWHSRISSFYLSFLNFLNLNLLARVTSDVLLAVAFFSFFSVYVFTGSASVAFSNEGLWLSVLTLAVIYFFYYLQTLENAGKDAISLEIENLKKLMLKNSELSNEVVHLEESTITFQLQVVSILEAWFVVISNFVDNEDNNSSFSALQVESLVDGIFVEHLKDLTNLNLSRENLIQVIALKDFSEEIVSEVFDNNLLLCLKFIIFLFIFWWAWLLP